MISTSEIAPSLQLAPYVRCYSLIEFDTKGLALIRPTNAQHEIAITFQFKSKPVRSINSEMVQNFGNTYGGVIGLFTKNIGDMVFNGQFSFFEIYFKPNGFYKLFAIPPKQLNDQLLFADDIFDPAFKMFYEKLGTLKDLNQMRLLADAFLINYLKKQNPLGSKDALAYVSNEILIKKGLVNIDKLAYDANIGIRTLERHFIEQVGIPPKLFCNITRFNHALSLKVKHPQLDWTSIALHCGYYDQMHLIKDFKKFAGSTPSIVLQQSHLPKIENTILTDE